MRVSPIVGPLWVVGLLGCQPGVLGESSGVAPGGDDEPPLRFVDGGPGSTPPPPGSDGDPGGGGATGDAGTADACGDVRARSAVYYGSTAPTYLDLSAGQVLSIGMMDMGGGLCSGTVIAPRWFLTAAHCTAGASPSRTTIRLGPDPSRPSVAIAARAFQSHPSADIALVELANDATAMAPDLVPLPVTSDTLDSSWIGELTEASGYGRTERGSTGTRYFSALPIRALTYEQIHIDGRGMGGVCNGDSGGPIMGRASDGSVRLLGVVSGGDGTCTHQAYFTRADATRDWIEGHTGPTTPPAPPPCGEVSVEGRCMDGRAIWCGVEDALQTETCGPDESCGWDAAASGYRCVPSGTDPCQGSDTHGRCDGAVARWCDRGVPRSRDCGACGQTCGVAAEHDGVYCLDV